MSDGCNLECDGLAGHGLYEDLHTTTELEDKMKCGLLNVVVTQGLTIL